MTEKPSAPTEKPSAMAYTAEAITSEMTDRVRGLAALSDGSRKDALRFAASVLKMPFGKVKRLYYGEVRIVPAHEADQIRAYCEAAEKLIQARANYEAERRAFLVSAGPILARLAPPEESGEAVPADQPEAVVKKP